MMSKVTKYLIPCLIGIIIYLIPVPQEVNPQGWKLLAIFIATIAALVTKPLPMSGVALVSLTIAILSGTVDEKEAFSGFASNVSWLVVLIFFIARAFIKSGLGKRIAYYFILKAGKSALGLGYSLVFTEFLIAPFMPSSAARAGGIIYPILLSITESVGSLPHDHTSRRLGSFLTQVCFHSNYITSMMFLTAMAANPMIKSFALEQKVNITWANWALIASVPGIFILILIPLFIYLIYPPELKVITNSAEFVKEKLSIMGKVTKIEQIMLAVFILMLVLWVVGEKFGINITTTALLGVSILLLTKVITLEDIVAEHEAWQTLLWFSILVMLSQQLQKLGIIVWFSKLLGEYIIHSNWIYSFIAIILVYFYTHYFFASITSHVSTMYAAFLSLAITTGSPPLLAALVLGFASSLFASLTHYGSTGGVVFFSANFVPVRKWWLIGFLTSIINLLILGIVGTIWWKFLDMPGLLTNF